LKNHLTAVVRPGYNGAEEPKRRRVPTTLNEFFAAHPKAALAFSGGADSAYLLYAALHCGAEVRAYYVQSAFQPRFERRDAERLARELRADLRVLDVDVLGDPEIAANPPDRCYFCKRRIFSAIRDAARSDGFPLLMDGTNASDEAGDRPGMRALGEMEVRSPLRECGLTKDEIRRRSREAGLFTWDKPAYACLATRIPAGEAVTAEGLRRTEAAEDFLFSLGFRDLRVRTFAGLARIQVPAAQMGRVLERREEIFRELNTRYGGVVLDLEARDE